MTFHLLAKLGEYVINITEMEKEEYLCYYHSGGCSLLVGFALVSFLFFFFFNFVIHEEGKITGLIWYILSLKIILVI